jgi:PTH1 family peptidyl-tRNA hydrolase
MEQSIALIVGLGNPDSQYIGTRHNAGFWFIDALAAQLRVTLSPNRKVHGDLCEASIASRRVRLLKPTTYMNRSGLSVGAAMRFFKFEPEQILVAYDEIDFPPGKVRLKFDGGHAGHNGVRDIIEHIGRKFWRLRLGVGHPGTSAAVVDHVLKRASKDDEQAIRNTIQQGIDMLPILIEHGGARAQHALHTADRARDETDHDGY